jgi:hypothetical protein
VFGPVAHIPIVPKTEIVRRGPLYTDVVKPGDYTMDYAAGTVTFNTAPAAGKVLTIDYSTSASGVDCFRAVTTYSSPPARSASGYPVTISGSDTWRSEENLAQYKAVAALTMFGNSVRTNMTDTYTGTPDFFTVSATWTMAEHGVLAPGAAVPYDYNYSVTVVGMQEIIVEAGTFNCYKVEYSILGVLQKTEWWAPEVGAFVKQEDVKTYAQTQTMELISFTA